MILKYYKGDNEYCVDELTHEEMTERFVQAMGRLYNDKTDLTQFLTKEPVVKVNKEFKWVLPNEGLRTQIEQKNIKPYIPGEL